MFSDEASLLKCKISQVLDLVVRPKEFPLRQSECLHVARMLKDYGGQLCDLARKIYQEATTADHIGERTEMIENEGAKTNV